MKSHLGPVAGLLSLTALGFAGGAVAQEVDDVTAVIDNLEPTSIVLIDGVADVTTTLIETQSLVAAQHATEDLVRAVIIAAVDGSPTLGDLGVAAGAGWLTHPLRSPEPVFAFVDDPSEETLEAAFNPDDVGTILRNLEDMPSEMLDGSTPGFTVGVRQAIYFSDANPFSSGTGLLQGDLQQGFQYATNHGLIRGLAVLLDDTNYREGYRVRQMAQQTTIGLANAFLESYLEDLSEETMPLFAEHVDEHLHQSLLGMPSIVEVNDRLEFDSTFELINYSELLDMAGI